MDESAQLGASDAAIELVRGSCVVDLHVESYIPPRLWGYDLARRHGLGPTQGLRFGHLDFPRALSGGLSAAMWSIATNILRRRGRRLEVLKRNTATLAAAIDAEPNMRRVRDASEMMIALRGGEHAALLAVQGGNAYDRPEQVAEVEDILRVTLVHLTDSHYGATSSPIGFGKGLSPLGKEFVAALNAHRVFVDLSHIDREGFFAALDVHEPSLPPIVTHTGVDGGLKHWRNLDDAQIRAIADRGGVIGIIFAEQFLRRWGMPKGLEAVMAHFDHLVNVGGEDVAAIGSDFDGFITPPSGLRDGATAYYRLADGMLKAGWKDQRIQKALGENFVRAFFELRPGDGA